MKQQDSNSYDLTSFLDGILPQPDAIATEGEEQLVSVTSEEVVDEIIDPTISPDSDESTSIKTVQISEAQTVTGTSMADFIKLLQQEKTIYKQQIHYYISEDVVSALRKLNIENSSIGTLISACMRQFLLTHKEDLQKYIRKDDSII